MIWMSLGLVDCVCVCVCVCTETTSRDIMMMLWVNLQD
jgi:hypothetical protein